MTPRRSGVLAALVLVIAVAVSSVSGQQYEVRGQRVMSGSSRRQVYRTSYTRETARARQDELVPEVVKINIEKEEQRRM